MEYKKYYKDLFYKKIHKKRMKWSYFNLLIDVNKIVIQAGKEGRKITVADISKLIGKSYRQTLRMVYDLAEAGFVAIIRGRNGGVVSNGDLIYKDFLSVKENMTFRPPTPLTVTKSLKIDTSKEGLLFKNHVFLLENQDKIIGYTKITNGKIPGLCLFIRTKIIEDWCKRYGYEEMDLINCFRRFIFWSQKCARLKLRCGDEIIGCLVKFVKNDFILHNRKIIYTDREVVPFGIYVGQGEADIKKFEEFFKNKYKRRPLEYILRRYKNDKHKFLIMAKGIKKWVDRTYCFDIQLFDDILESFMKWIFEKMRFIPEVEKNIFGMFIKSIDNYLEWNEIYPSSDKIIERLIRGIAGDKSNNRHRGGEVQSIKDIIQCMVVGDPVLERKGQKDGGVLS